VELAVIDDELCSTHLIMPYGLRPTAAVDKSKFTEVSTEGNICNVSASSLIPGAALGAAKRSGILNSPYLMPCGLTCGWVLSIAQIFFIKR